MRIRRLRLRNFRRYRDADVEMPDGVTALLGPNGAGKSTLLEAIGFALFGPTATRTAKPLLRLDGAAPADPVEVELEVELGGQALRIVRELRGKTLTPQATLEADGVVLVPPGAGSSEAATAAIEARLGMDRDAFFTTVVARQGELSLLSDAKPAERKKLLLRMLGIDQVDAAVDRARQSRRDVESQLEALRKVLPDPARLQEESEAAARSLSLVRVDASRASTAHAEATATLTAARSGLEAARQAASARQAADVALRNAERMEMLCVQALRDAQAKAQAAHDAAAQAAAAGDTHARLTAAHEAHQLALAHESARKRHADAVRAVQLQRQRVARLEAERAAVPPVPVFNGEAAHLEEEVQALTHELDQVKQQRAVAELQRKEMAERLEHLGHVGSGAACPTCEAPLGERLTNLLQASRTRLDTVATQLASFEPAARETAQRITLLRTEQKRLHEAQLRAQKDTERLAQLDRDLAREREALEHLERDPPADPGPVPDLLRLQREAATARQQHDARTRHEALAAQLPYLEGDLSVKRKAWEEAAAAREQAAHAVPPLDPAQLPAAQQRLSAAEQQDRATLTALRDAESRLVRAEGDVAACQRRAEDAAKARAEESRLEVEAREWGAVVGKVAGTGLLERFRDHLVGRVGPAIGHEAGRLLAAFTGGRFTEVRLSEDYEVFVADGGTLYTLDRFSGGQQDMVHLALRLAVSRMLAERGGTEIRFLALDEVFGSLDRAHRDLVVGALQQLGGLYAQVLVISHLEGLREELGQALVVGEDAEGLATLALRAA